MTEENKDDLTQQPSFLSDHEKLLKTINAKKTKMEDEATAEPIKKSAPAVDSISITKEPKSQSSSMQKSGQKSAPNKLNGKKKKSQSHSKRDAEADQRHQDVLKQQMLEQQEVKEVLTFIQKYAKPAAIGVVTICVLILGSKFFQAQGIKKETAADAALMQANSIPDLQAIVDHYGSTSAGPIAWMSLARETFNSGKIDEAEALYTQFIKQHGELQLAVQAELNVIACKEANGLQDDALLLYGQFIKEHKNSFLVPTAMMGKARCLESLGQLDEAQIAYEDLIINFPENTWGQMAEANLRMMLSKKQ